jgi:hypothetical protein
MFGLGCDYMIGASVVVARNGGEIATCSADENADLFWAIKGGGRTLGIVVSMTFAGLPDVSACEGKFAAGQRVYLPTGMLTMPDRKAVMDHLLRRCVMSRPIEYNVAATFIGGGAMNPCIVTEFWFGENAQQGLDYFKETKEHVGLAVADTYGVHPYHSAIQKWANGPKGEDVGPGSYHFRGIMPKTLTPGIAEAMVNALNMPQPDGITTVMLVDKMGGGKSQDKDAATKCAVPERPNFWIIILAQWKPEITGHEEGRATAVVWVRDLWKALTLECNKSEGDSEHILDSSHGSTDDLMAEALQFGQQAKFRQLFGDSTERMKRIKAAFDPDNVCGVLKA